MKLHLPSGLLAALLAGFLGAASSAHALTVWDTTNATFTISDTSADYTQYSLSYDADDGMITGLDDSGYRYSFLLDNNALKTTSADTHITYVGNNNDSCKWGFNTTGSGDITGYWFDGSTERTWTNKGTISQTTTLSDLANENGQITLYADISTSGTYLYTSSAYDADSRIYNGDSLYSSASNVKSLYINPDLIKSISITLPYADSGGNSNVTVSNADGSWTDTYGTVARLNGESVSYDNGAVDATLATSGRLYVTNTNIGSINANGGTIVAGGAGQLFLQTWGSGDLVLNNAIILGSSTYTDTVNSTDTQFGALRFGNDGGTVTLTGSITLVEDAVVSGVVNDAHVVNINGTITGAYDFKVRQGKELHFNGAIDTKTLTITGQSEVTISNSVTTTGNFTITGESADTGSTATITGDMNLGGNLTVEKNSVVNIDGGTHTVKELDVSKANSSKGTVNIGANASMHVNTNVWLTQGATINIAEGGILEKGGIRISGKGETGATIINTSGSDDQYKFESSTYSISNAAITLTSDNDNTLKNKLTNVDLTHAGTGTLTVDNSNNTLSAIETASTLNLLNIADGTASIDSVTLKDGATVGVYTGDSTSSDLGTLSTTNLTAGSGSSLASALTMGGESAILDLGSSIALSGALALGSDITLQGDILDSSAKIALFTNVASFTVNGEEYSDIVAASEIFKNFQNTDTTQYAVSYEGNTVYLLTRSIPEPASTTLGLLALAGLCARRRRR